MANQGLDPKRLFINKLPAAATKEDVLQYFGQFGTLTDCYLPNQPGTAQHKGIAYITFSDAVPAERVLSQGRHLLRGQEVFVEVSAPRQAGVGPPASTLMPVAPSNAFSPSPFPAAQPVPPVYPVAQAPQVYPVAPTPDEGGEVLCMKEIPHDVNKEDLAQYFAQFGQIREMRLPLDRTDPTRHSGLCIIAFAEPKSMINVLLHAQKQPHVIKGHALLADVVCPSQMVAMGERPVIQKLTVGIQPEYKGFGTSTFRRVFLSKVTPEIDERILRSYFGQFGDIEDVFRPAGGTKGVAFVKFRFVEPAQVVVSMRNHYCFEGQCVIAGESVDDAKGAKAKGKGNEFLANLQVKGFSPY